MQKAALREEFGGWSIIRTADTGRWWATRTSDRARLASPLTGADVVTELDADTGEELRLKLREVADAEAAGR